MTDNKNNRTVEITTHYVTVKIVGTESDELKSIINEAKKIIDAYSNRSV